MIAETDEIVRLQSAWRSLSLDAAPQAGCPESDRLWDAVQGKLGPGEVREVIEHTATCGACAEAWRLARDLGHEAGEGGGLQRSQEVAARAPAYRRWRAASWGTAVAAAALLAVVGFEWRGSFEPRPPVVLRGGGETAAIQSLVPAGEVLPRHDFVLRWEGPEGARYRLRVTTEDLTVLVEATDLEASEYQVAEEDLAAIATGSRLFWKVTARGRGGETSATLEVLVE